MTLIVLQNFTGYNRLRDAHAIPDNAAATATNVDVQRGVLQPFYKPSLEKGIVLRDGAKSVYEIVSGGNKYWLSWVEDVYLTYVPEGKADTRSIVFASPSFEPRWGKDTDLISGAAPYPNTFYVLGVVRPVTAPSVTATGGTAASESRTYVYTFVTEDGHESAPSPASPVVTAPSDATWDVSVPDTAPPNSGNVTNVAVSGSVVTLTLDSVFGLRAFEQIRVDVPGLEGVFRIVSVDAAANQITIESSSTPTSTTGTWSRVAPHKAIGLRKRLYRSTGAGFSLVTNPDGTAYEVDASVTVMTDDATKGLGESLPAYDRLMPPADLEQITVLPNGMMVGFRGTEVCFSEPYIFYAWPVEYRYSLEYKVKGLAVVGNTVFVATESAPYAFTGVAPENMTSSVVGEAYPCVSGRSVTPFENGMLYASNVGLVAVSVSGGRVLTKDFIAYDVWQNELNPSTMQSLYIDGRYYARYVDKDGFNKVFMLDIVRPDYYVMDISVAETDCIATDHERSWLYFARNGALYKWNNKLGEFLSYRWDSKRFLLPKPTSLSAFRIDGRYTADEQEVQSAIQVQQAINQGFIGQDDGSFNGSALNVLPLNGSRVVLLDDVAKVDLSLTFQVYVDRKLKFSKTIGNERIHRIPYFGRFNDVQFRLIGRPTVFRVVVGSNPTELEKA